MEKQIIDKCLINFKLYDKLFLFVKFFISLLKKYKYKIKNILIK